MITTVGGGVFGVVNASIAVLAGGDKDDKPGAAASPKPSPSDRPSGPGAGEGESSAEPNTRLTDCRNSTDQWNRLPEIPGAKDFAPMTQRVDFADINGDGRDDYLVVDAGTGAVRVWENRGTKSGAGFAWGPGSHLITATTLAPGREYVDFADVDGDGFDDHLVVNSENGSVRARKNHDGRLSGTEWKADAKALHKKGTNPGIVFADIDGDRRDDYLAFDLASGDVAALLGLFDRSGPRPDPEHLAQVVTVDLGEGERLAFHNVDCDSRADALISDENGPLRARMHLDHDGGGGLVWAEEKQIATGDELDRRTQYRDFADLDGDGRADSLWVNRTTGEVTPWLNRGGD
ncbi:FG-GAP repeat domain-containing protein [Streptomyces yaizuensis]|uniref:VCBS repeat-containing protein n=1 Tax=Streptomyces yaizuensis TaxID=2989713 RepID=A0ABQ5NWU9_9ACTN|nr:VCBS repeat-containing protein [Streptomyces sp. YSPA8]GLF94834.1 VCBS repeat-containing protein [Streptomyces sp. YSPA8]